MSEQNATSSGQFESLYEMISENIRFTKRRQWMLAYYVLLADAAIIGVFLKLFTNTGVPRPDYLLVVYTFVILPAFLIYIFGIYLLMDIQNDLCNDRNTLEKIVCNLPNDAKNILKAAKPKTFFYSWQYPVSIIFGMSFGLLYIFIFTLKEPNQCLFNIAVAVLVLELIVVVVSYCCAKNCAVK